MNADTIIHFWFNDIEEKSWFIKDQQFDDLLRTRFYDLNRSAAKGELFNWRTTAQGRLAEIIVLDQFSRNLFRGDPRSFASDPMSLTLAQEAVALGLDKSLPLRERGFLYMPYMHSESLAVHHEALKLFDQPGLEGTLEFEISHMKIIEQFGHYPHRNEIVGRKCSAQEIEFLGQKGSSF